MSILETKDLCVGYGEKVVVNNIKIEGERGMILCLLGPNGAGKTTILRTLSGLLTSVKGGVLIKGNEIANINKKDLAKKLSVVLTNKFDGGLMTVFEVASMGRYPHTDFFGKLTETDIHKTMEALETVNATNLTHRYFDELSDGEKQKVLIARALVQEPEIIILDEPTSHLDIKHRLELVEILKRLSKEKGISVILSLHEIDIALKSCDKVVLINKNKVIAYGTPEEVVNEDIIKELYNINDANFNNLLGTIELSNFSVPEVFVIGGAGAGASVYRILTKSGIGFVTGIIHENDVDYEIARTMGVHIESEEPFKKIGECNISKCKTMIQTSNIIIDTDYPIGDINKKNIDLTRYALEMGKKVLSLRTEEDINNIYKDKARDIIHSQGLSHIVDEIKKYT
ncbi:ABC transporter ATP-binding protein [Clostridium cochlearium]|uniref:ABC transporter ATP-binding protein n=1 Tax=Clostridium cochlearium TaxID=1494 RepID=UPI001792FB9A|nr:ABC transporter ATP-binding protein [Clostridium cochlearium]NMA57844.1 ABC transporter ATP-binding protein [Clostridium cochlearium]